MKNYTAIFTMMILGLIILASAQAAFAVPPVNNNFANATPIVLNNSSGSVIQGNFEATKEVGEPMHAENVGGTSVWFSFTPTTTSVYRINITESTLDSLLAVYTGASLADLQSVGHNDECYVNCAVSTVDLMLTAGTTYYIAVDGKFANGAADEGVFKIAILEFGMPLQDDLVSAYPLGTSRSASIAGTNYNATRQAGEPEHYAASLPGEKSVWYKWKPNGNFATRVELTENYNSVLAVYSANTETPTFAQLTELRQSYDAFAYNGTRYRAEFFAQSNKYYFIAVAGNHIGNSITAGNFQLKIAPNPIRYSADYEWYDDKAAISVFRPSDGVWHNLRSYNALPESVLWGQNGDTPIAADFEGSGATQIAVARNQNGVKNWYMRGAQFSGLTWGLATDRAVTGDFDGDGRADVGVMRLTANGYAWYIRQSTNGAMRSFLFGTTGDKPVFGDFDGDGMTEVSIVRNGVSGITWYMLKSSTNYQQFAAQQFGTGGDLPAAEDFDGDGKSDIAVFRPSTGYWYILQSSNGALDFKVFGAAEDKPQPADYDGDGRADVGVFRPSNGTWYILRSGNGQAMIKQFGAATDIPVSSMTTLSN
jgi:hypothetical protein